MIAPQIIVADLRVRLDRGKYRVSRQGRDCVPVKEVPRDQDRLHTVPVRILRKARKIAQKFIPPALGAVLIKMGLQPGVQMQVCTMYQLQFFISLALAAFFPTGIPAAVILNLQKISSQSIYRAGGLPT